MTDTKRHEQAVRAPRTLTRREVLARGGLLAGAVALGGPVSANAAQRRFYTSRSGTTITWGTEEDPTFLIPFDADSGATWQTTGFIYDSLMRWDRNLNVLPALAVSYSAPNDHTFVFKLRQGVKFHSGKEMDAEDVKYSLAKQGNPPPPAQNQGFYPPIASVDVVDKYTVRLNMSSPAPSTLGYFAWSRDSGIVPNGFFESTDVRTHTNGTGPFMLQEYVPNDHVTLVKNPNYWLRGVPKVDTLILKVLSDEGARYDSLRSGVINGALFSADTARVAATDNNLVVQKGLIAQPNELEISLKDPTQPWHDVRVRQAINHAIDRQDILNKVFAGQGVFSGKIAPGFGNWPIPASQLVSNYEKYDVNKASALLAAAGQSKGFEITMNSISAPAFYTQVAEVVQDQLGKVGIKVSVVPMEIGTFSVHDGNGTFQWESTGRGMRGDVSEFFSDFDPSGGTYQAWFDGGWKTAMPQGAKLESLLAQGNTTLDNAKRHSIYRQAEAIILTEWPEMPLVNPYVFQIVSNKLQGMYVSYTTSFIGLTQATIS
jgi:peptide/nickel transport system substrate-binding protein